VTDRSSPKLLWQINGGSGSFTELAQTWSQPTFAQILQGGVRTPVLVFGGGYSATDHDTATSFSSTGDAAGNAIFIVNAKTGALIKRFSSGDNADMKWSIASSVSVVDVDFDGIADFLYAADLAGQVFRVDLNRAEGATDSLSSTRVATVAQLGRTVDTGSANQRRFYAAPTIAMSRRGGENVLQVLIGSGYRTYPLNTAAQDRFYALNDADALLAPTSLSPALRASDLSDITDGSSYDETSKGWMYRLTEPGEKVLSNAVVMEGVVYFTTFLPESRTVNKCQRVIGASRLYGLSLLKGAPAIDFDGDGYFDPFRELILPGLPPSPQLLLGPEGQQVLLTGTAATDIGDAAGLGLRRTRWYQVPNKEAADAVLEEATASAVTICSEYLQSHRIPVAFFWFIFFALHYGCG
jgi:type IV pilus assembly protein PilY1